MEKISTSLPFYIRLPDDTYKFHFEGEAIEFLVTKETIQPSMRTGSRSADTHFHGDRRGIDEYSVISYETERQFSSIDEAKSFTVKLVNRVLDVYRYIDQATHLMPITATDFHEFNLLKDGRLSETAITFGPGGLVLNDGGLINEIGSLVKRALEERIEVPFFENILLNAHHYHLTGEYRMSVLEAVIALEIIVYQFIREFAPKSGKSQKQIDGWIEGRGRESGLRYCVETVLNMLLPFDVRVSSDLISRCGNTVTLRNKVVHRGKKDVTEVEATSAITFSLEIIRHLNRFISS